MLSRSHGLRSPALALGCFHKHGAFLGRGTGTTAALAGHRALGFRNTLTQGVHQVDDFSRPGGFVFERKRRILLLCLNQLSKRGFIIVFECANIKRMRIGLDKLRCHGELLFVDTIRMI